MYIMLFSEEFTAIKLDPNGFICEFIHFYCIDLDISTRDRKVVGHNLHLAA